VWPLLLAGDVGGTKTDLAVYRWKLDRTANVSVIGVPKSGLDVEHLKA